MPFELLVFDRPLKRGLVEVGAEAHQKKVLPLTEIVVDALQGRQFRHARPTPGRPEIEQDNLVLDCLLVDLGTGERLQFERRTGIAHFRRAQRARACGIGRRRRLKREFVVIPLGRNDLIDQRAAVVGVNADLEFVLRRIEDHEPPLPIGGC